MQKTESELRLMKPNPLTFDHPCFCNDCGDVSRLHLAVAPRCNIKCCFCTPTVSPCVHGCLPGVTSRVLTPEEAVGHIALMQEIHGCAMGIVGIAGPGEPLCNPETFETVALVRRAFPQAHVCLSTNGLLLGESVPRMRALGVETLTVTVNAATAATGALIYERVLDLIGEAGAELLLRRQWEGVRAAVEAGLVVKLNSVFVPGVNGGELAQIARLGREAGANIHNILPLIPRDQLAEKRVPDQCELHRARAEAGAELTQFTRCRHCRADAVVLARPHLKEE